MADLATLTALRERVSQGVARRIVRSLVNRGLIIKPEICSRCEVQPPRGIDGRSLIQGHHYKGYEHPTEVQWLCVKCHRQVTPVAPREKTGGFIHRETLRGSGNPFAKLDEKKVSEILARLANGEQGKAIAFDFGVTPTEISGIRRCRIWKHVQRPLVLSALIAKEAARG
jgi:uncharacterized protein (DUF433 family)